MVTKNRPYTVLILAAGKAERWMADFPKQLVDIDGTPLIVRTYNEATKVFGTCPFIVTNNQEVSSFFPEQQVLAPENSNFTLETLISTTSIWSGKIVVLLGDTCYEGYVLEKIRDDDREIMFYGRLMEIYALAFKHYVYLIGSIKSAVDQATVGNGSGKLWHLWYQINGYPIDQHTFPETSNRYFQQLNPKSITMDVDTWDDYMKLKEKLKSVRESA